MVVEHTPVATFYENRTYHIVWNNVHFVGDSTAGAAKVIVENIQIFLVHAPSGTPTAVSPVFAHPVSKGSK